jgi:hypothetical protein
MANSVDAGRNDADYQNQQSPFGNAGNDQAGYNQAGYNQPGYNQPGYNQPGYNQPGYNQPGYNQPSYNQPGYNQPGYNQPGYNQGYPQNPVPMYGGGEYVQKSRIVAGILNILIPIGIGRFYLGYTSLGAGQLVVTLLTCGVGSLWSIIDGIVILTGTPSVDANNVLLKD